MRRIFAFLALAVLLASCNGAVVPGATPTLPVGAPSPGPEPTPGGDQATISFAAWDYERSVYEPLAEKFNQENPGITVVIISLDDFMNVDPAAAGGTPDSQMAMLRRIVSGADTSYAFAITPEALGTPLLLDLAPQMDADATFNREDFYPGALERWSKGGGIYALPRSFYVQTLTYNKDLFQVAGLSDPEPGWSWSDLLAAAEQVQQTIGSSGYGYLDTSGGMLPALAMLKQRGIDLLTLSPSEVQLTDPAYNETL
jgi:ABC-type glycerol-3-phosphate transport system substrate-binding protein